MQKTRTAYTILILAYFWYYAFTYTAWHFIDWVNLIFHEAGHSIFAFFGDIIHAFMGSGFQVLLPLLIALYFFYQKDKVSGGICLAWVGQNLLNVGVYIGDAIVMKLDLLGGDSVMHDWNFILSQLGLLKYTYIIADTVHVLGWATIFAGSVIALTSLLPLYLPWRSS